MEKLVKIKVTKDGSGNVLGPNLTLEINKLLELFPSYNQSNELKQVTFAVLRNIVLFRKIFKFYCKVGSPKKFKYDEKTSSMTRFQLWRFLKDTKAHQQNGHNLANIDNVISIVFEFKDIHNPTDKFEFSGFLKCCVALSYSLYKDCFLHSNYENNVLSKCLQRFLDDHLMNYSFVICGQFLNDNKKATKALMYMEKSWRVYQYLCLNYSNKKLPKMRQFLFMLRDFEILSKHLSIKTTLKILAFDDPLVSSNNDDNFNMDLEMTFLEFFEALIGCALCYGFDNVKLMHPSKNYKESSDISQELNGSNFFNYNKTNNLNDFNVWGKQIQNFFTKILFPNWRIHQKLTRAAYLGRSASSTTVAVHSL